MLCRVIIFVILAILLACQPSPHAPANPDQELSDQALLDTIQRATFRYFWDFAHPVSRLSPERTSTPQVVTSGGTGFGIMSIVVGVHRQWISRTMAVERLQKMVDFLGRADRFHGAWPHWMDGQTGRVVPFSLHDNGGDLVETSFLINGLLMAQSFFDQEDAPEVKLRSDIQQLWETVEWDWYTQGGRDSLYWHWSPTYGWKMNFAIGGFNECLITYILALASPTHPIDSMVYQKCWKAGKEFNTPGDYLGYHLDMGFPYGGPLFFSHYSFLGLDPKWMQDDRTFYWRHNVTHTMINRTYCMDEAPAYYNYSPEIWGLTASDDFYGYGAHNPANDNGTITPSAALSALPYTPYYSMLAMRKFYHLKDSLWGPYGFYDAFSLHDRWYSRQYLAIDQGPIVVMMENYRSGLPWSLFSKRKDVLQGLQRAGIHKPEFKTGFAFAVREKRNYSLDLVRHPDRGNYQVELFVDTTSGPLTLDLLGWLGEGKTRLWDNHVPPHGYQVLDLGTDLAPGVHNLSLQANGEIIDWLKIVVRK